MKLEVGKEYTQRDGAKVRVLALDSKYIEECPVLTMELKTGSVHRVSIFGQGQWAPHDIVPQTRKITGFMMVNVDATTNFPNTCLGIYREKSEAERLKKLWARGSAKWYVVSVDFDIEEEFEL